MRDGVVHVVGHLNNRQDPIRLGAVTEENPIVSFLKVAQNIDIDDKGVATTRDGQVERLLGDVSSLWVHPQDDKIAYFKSIVEAIDYATITEFDLGATSILYVTDALPATRYRLTFNVTVGVGTLNMNLFPEFSLPNIVNETGAFERIFTTETDGLLLRFITAPGSTYSVNSISLLEVDAFDVPLLGNKTLKQLNVDFTTTDIATLNSSEDISYELINGVVFLSNGVDIGYIENGAFIPFSQALGRDELLMPAGKYIAFDDNDGCLLVASGSTIYKSKPWNPQVRDARYSEFPMNGNIRMLATVEDGWWIATEKNVSFAQRDGEDGYNFKHISDNPPADGAFNKHIHFDRDDNGKTSAMEVHWASQDGFCEGKAGGSYLNLSYPNITLPEGDKGKLFSRNVNGTEQLLAIIFNPVNDDNFVEPTLLKNSITP